MEGYSRFMVGVERFRVGVERFCMVVKSSVAQWVSIEVFHVISGYN